MFVKRKDYTALTWRHRRSLYVHFLPSSRVFLTFQSRLDFKRFFDVEFLFPWDRKKGFFLFSRECFLTISHPDSWFGTFVSWNAFRIYYYVRYSLLVVLVFESCEPLVWWLVFPPKLQLTHGAFLLVLLSNTTHVDIEWWRKVRMTRMFNPSRGPRLMNCVCAKEGKPEICCPPVVRSLDAVKSLILLRIFE